MSNSTNWIARCIRNTAREFTYLVSEAGSDQSTATKLLAIQSELLKIAIDLEQSK